MPSRLDLILEQYEKDRERARTLRQLQEAASRVVERIETLPGDKTLFERWILSFFRGLSQ